MGRQVERQGEVGTEEGDEAGRRDLPREDKPGRRGGEQRTGGGQWLAFLQGFTRACALGPESDGTFALSESRLPIRSPRVVPGPRGRDSLLVEKTRGGLIPYCG